MSLDSDVALLGTGIAPLVAANYLLAQGKSVLLLNPDWDFFLEDSELPLDPLLPGRLDSARLLRSSPDHALAQLRPDFPGAIEFWSPQVGPQSGYHDPAAPHVRQRGRLWISPSDANPFWNWERLEDFYVETSDAGFNPQILEGPTVARRFPGFSSKAGNHRGLFIPKLCDVDTVRYRNGLLEFVQERLDPQRVACAVNQLEWMPDGVRFHSKGSVKTAKLNIGMLVFWTPRLSPWVMSQSKKAEVTPHLPLGVRLWEQWLLNSRDPPDPSTVGMFGDMTVWADFQGTPSKESTAPHLSVLRAGPRVEMEELNLPQGGLNWASSDSFDALSDLCHGFLRWDKFSIRALRARAIFEWDRETHWLLSKTDPVVRVVGSCDGPLVDVVQAARTACNQLISENEKKEGESELRRS